MTSTIASPEVVEWLMQGDVAIQWQTMRDVLGSPAPRWRAVRQRVAREGWGGKLLDLCDPRGTWGGGIYGPKWTSTTYTLLLLRDMGLPRRTPAAAKGARIIVDSELGAADDREFARRLANLDLCVVGMDLALLTYFDARDQRAAAIVEQLLAAQRGDGGWNCAQKRREVFHSSLHTTINVLDGLADYARYRGKAAAAKVAEPIRRAEEFLLRHRLFRSDKTGEVIRSEFLKFSFPPRWHWDVLRGLDHFARTAAPRDPRLADAIDLLRSRRGPDGLWKLENHHKGREFFPLEKPGQPSRWNTLRSLRILRWWG
jgi:hypothetical protein